VFAKILIANRGEIACRIIATARRMGIATVAVFSEADRDALHVTMADEAIAIGPAPATASYLAIDTIVAACRSAGADAVHPGYGFLSERAEFAEALAAAGVAFIGPHAGAIRAMGDKIESKKLAADCGVSTVPGHLGTVDNDSEAIAVAGEIGLPVMIKASAGGGGKGMRVAFTDAEVAAGVRSARAEARAAFGDERVFIERYVESPRHIEVQVLGDGHGNVVHLGERECSLQRRHQKVIEEAPSPAVDARLRETMGRQAVALAEAVRYDSAGTVEFIMDRDGRFYFLEMNTRLQVEHPVTEAVTGLDLVELMIRSAAGEPLAFAQSDVRHDGWAIEARLYAEDPGRGFLPAIGRLTRYRPPPVGRNGTTAIRIDSGVREGAEISIHYDPMIAKLIVHDADRNAATDAMADALERFVVDGVASNRAFLAAVMANRRWREGRLSTDFIAEEFADGTATPADAAMRERLAMVAVAIAVGDERRSATLPGRIAGKLSGRRGFVVAIGEDDVVLTAHVSADGSVAIRSGRGRPRPVVSDWRPGEPVWAGTVGGEAIVAQVHRDGGGLILSCRGVTVAVRVMAPHVAELARLMPEKHVSDAAKLLRCPMPGVVVRIDVAPGQAVRAGQPLAVVEAMKMENVLRAERDATVARLTAAAGDTLAVDDVIMEFE